MIPTPPVWVLDIECYPNFFMVKMRNVYTKETLRFDHWYPHIPLSERTIVTFNGNNYDIPLISLALTGASNETLKQASDDIIIRGLKPWDLEDKYGFKRIEIDHIDLIEVAPGQASLKTYGGRLHSKKLQDLPIDPATLVTDEQKEQLSDYCDNDLDTTIDLYMKLLPQIELREAMSKEFGIDLRSKSDPQIAEAVIRSECQKLLGRKIYRPDIDPRTTFKYSPPSWLTFQSEGLKRVLDIIKNINFSLDPDGSILQPDMLKSMRIAIGEGRYQMGIGGLHSLEKSIAYRADENWFIRDRDVTAYYPSLILNENIYPEHIGPAFSTVYKRLVDARVEAKRIGDKVRNESNKTVIVGTFGKLENRWSCLFSPQSFIQVTLTGQLALLMLIELMEACDFKVISANTDGIVIWGHRNRGILFDNIIDIWEIITGLKTEETTYAALYSKDVNNYIAIKEDGSAKVKGAYCEASQKGTLDKNPTNFICNDAVIAYLSQGVPIEYTVLSSTDIRKFLTVRKVDGGACFNGSFLGKSIRWYYGPPSERFISYAKNGNKVPRSDGAIPLMELTGEIPSDLNYEWYIDEAKSILGDIGASTSQ